MRNKKKIWILRNKKNLDFAKSTFLTTFIKSGFCERCYWSGLFPAKIKRRIKIVFSNWRQNRCMVWSDEHWRHHLLARWSSQILFGKFYLIIYYHGIQVFDRWSISTSLVANEDPRHVLVLIYLIFVEWRVNIRTTRTKRRPSVCFEQKVVDMMTAVIEAPSASNDSSISCNHLIAAKILLIKKMWNVRFKNKINSENNTPLSHSPSLALKLRNATPWVKRIVGFFSYSLWILPLRWLYYLLKWLFM